MLTPAAPAAPKRRSSSVRHSAGLASTSRQKRLVLRRDARSRSSTSWAAMNVATASGSWSMAATREGTGVGRGHARRGAPEPLPPSPTAVARGQTCDTLRRASPPPKAPGVDAHL